MIGISVNDDERGPLPRDLPGLLVWYRSDLEVTGPASTVRGWGDLSGSGLTAGQAIAAERPTLGPGSANLPKITFDPSAPGPDDLSNSAITNAPAASYTLLMVINPTSAVGSPLSMRGDPAIPGQRSLNLVLAFGVIGFGPLNGGGGAPAITPSAPWLGQDIVVGAQQSTAQRTIRINNVQMAASVTADPAPAPTRLRIGDIEPQLTVPYDGDIYEMALWSPQISDADLGMLEQWAMARYGIT